MTQPRWRLEDFLIWYPRWLHDFHPVLPQSRSAVLGWAETVRATGPDVFVIAMDDEEGMEVLEPIAGTEITVSYLLYKSSRRMAVTRITGW